MKFYKDYYIMFKILVSYEQGGYCDLVVKLSLI